MFAELAGEFLLRGMDRERFVTRAAHYLGEVNAVHPFREGNGRAQRALFTQLADQAGWRLDFAGVGRQENIAASISSFHGDPGPLRALLDRAVIGPVDPADW